MFCKTCGAVNPDNENFCTSCGASLAVETMSVEEAPVAKQAHPGKALGVVALILGIVSIVIGATCSCACACAGGIAPLCVAVAGIIVGIIGISKSKSAGLGNGMAVTGLILSIVAIVVIVLFVLLNGIIGGIMGSSGDYYNFYNYY